MRKLVACLVAVTFVAGIIYSFGCTKAPEKKAEPEVKTAPAPTPPPTPPSPPSPPPAEEEKTEGE